MNALLLNGQTFYLHQDPVASRNLSEEDSSYSFKEDLFLLHNPRWPCFVLPVRAWHIFFIAPSSTTDNLRTLASASLKDVKNFFFFFSFENTTASGILYSELKTFLLACCWVRAWHQYGVWKCWKEVPPTRKPPTQQRLIPFPFFKI